VRVLASSINPVDGYIVSGSYGTGELTYPVVPGRDFCGTVIGTGSDVTGFHRGDRVLGCWTKTEFRLGAWADFMIVPAECAVTLCPVPLSPHQAAALPLAAATAQLALDALEPAPGEPLLIVGASGAVGCYAVQLAAARGAQVIATAKGADEARVRSLGAAETVDYTQVDVIAAVRELYPDGVPMLFDIVNDKPAVLGLAELVGPGGRVASARFAADRRLLSERGLRASNVAVTNVGDEVLAPTLALAASGKLSILISDVRPLEDLPTALPEFERGGRGKVVIDVAA
jgi:NADPH:quinone reductase-like Zn-dependent oxidoreductase